MLLELMSFLEDVVYLCLEELIDCLLLVKLLDDLLIFLVFGWIMVVLVKLEL